jgi:hypothetical protein
MRKCGYSDDEIALTVDDAVRYHSCHDGQIPKSLEGKILATADALFHLETDFYIYSVWAHAGEGATLVETKEYVLKKLDRDFKNKILFDDEREKARGDYKTFKRIFSK